MKKNVFSAKEFNGIVKGAKVEIKGTFNNPFVVVNLLNKAVKGDFSKINNCDIKPENLKKVANVCKGMHKNRYAFDVCLFEKDSFGRFCTLSPFKGEKGDLFADYYDINNLSVLIYTDNKGREIVENEKGDLYTCVPISLTINGIFSAFAKVAKVDIIANEKSAKGAEKAAKDSAKEYEKAKKGVISDYNAGRITEIDLATKLSELKEKYANVA
jgi:hypothetical protein